MHKTKIFKLEDQLSFAELSGDYNPMHIDLVKARRMYFNRVVVHGIHLLLSGLDLLCEDMNRGIYPVSLRVSFLKPVSINTEVEYEVSHAKGKAKIEVRSLGETMVRATLEFVESNEAGSAGGLHTDNPPRLECEKRPLSAISGSTGEIPLHYGRTLSDALFPSLAKKFPAIGIAQLLGTTRIVGMINPGLYSIFTGLKLKWKAQASEGAALNWRTAHFSEEHRMVEIAVASGDQFEGTLQAFAAPEPVLQPSFVTIKDAVTPDEFRDMNVLIVGGSRGLGETGGKILCAGGASVCISYNSGREEAEQIAKEITQGGGRITAKRLNVMATQFESELSEFFQSSAAGFNCLVYFATPSIFRGNDNVLAPSLLQEFIEFYVTRFWVLAARMMTGHPETFRIVYPSSISLEHLPSNMIEYSIAKGAGETAVQFLTQAFPQCKLIAPRLPRLATDQTASVSHAPTEDAVTVLLSEFRKLRSL